MNQLVETDGKRHLQTLSISRANSFRRCPRLSYFEYEQRIRPVRRDGPRAFGGGFHSAQDVIWNAASQGLAAKKAALDGWLKTPTVDREPAEFDPYVFAMLRALLIGYLARWHAEDVEVLAVERKFSMPLVNPSTGAPSKTFVLNGRIDAIIRWRGQVWVLEHKTTSEDIGPGSDYWRKLRIDPQCSTYIDAARAIGFDAEGVIYSVTKKPLSKPYKATPLESRKYTKEGKLYAQQRERDETPEEFEARILAAIAESPEKFFAWCEVPRLEGEIEEAQADLWQTALALREAQRSGRFPRNPNACFMFHSECDFFDVCTKAARLDDTSRFKKLEEKTEKTERAA